MSAAKAAPPPRTARARKRVDADTLADDLDRVLKVSQPKAAPRRTVSGTKAKPEPKAKPAPKPAARTAVAKPRIDSGTAEKVPVRRVARPGARPATNTAKAAAPPEPEAPPKPEEELPWLKAGAMSSRERAVAAQAASNDALRLLGEALQAGFKYTSPKGKWTNARADATLRSGRDGLAVLRELYGGAGSAVARRATVERGAIALVTRCVALEMYIPALSFLADVRPHLVAMYEHEVEDDAQREALPPLTEEWTMLFDLPPPVGEVDDVVRPVLGCFTLAAWCCLLPLGLQPELAVYLYRAAREDGYAPGSAAWLQIRQLAAFASALSASGSGDAKNSPERVWSSVRRTIAIHLEKGGDDAREEVAAHIGPIVDVVEALWVARGESREAWFCGHWGAVLDLWTELGRMLGDSDVVDRVLSAATAGASLASSSSSSSTPTPSSSSHTSPASTPKRAKLIPRVANASGEATRLCAHLAKVLVDTCVPSLDEGVYETSLASIDFEAILSTLCSLSPSERSQETRASLLRAVERLRRAVKSLDAPAFAKASTAWLQSYLDFAARLLSEVASGDVARECIPGLIDTAVALLRYNTTPECTGISPKQLDGVFAALDAQGAEFDITTRTNYANCLIHSTYSVALAFSRTGAMETAAELCRCSCQWSQTFLAHNGDAEAVVRKAIAEPLVKRWELLGYCLQKGVDKTSALEAFIHAFLSLDSAAIKQIAKGAASQPLRVVFADMPEFTSALKRTLSLLAHDPALGPEFPALLANALNNKQWSPSVTGAVLEQVADALEPSQFLPHVQDVLVSLLHMALDMYEPEYHPVRRLRVITRFVSVITSTGVASERYEWLSSAADTLAIAKELERDAALAKFRQEYYASIVIHAALQTYHRPESSTGLAEIGRVALDACRAFILPPPSAAAKRGPPARGKAAMAPKPRAAARTTTRKVTPTAAKKTAKAAVDEPPPIELDDAERFSSLLGALASLFGLLGYIVPKIEALNLLRTLQRTNMPDAFIATSAQVAAEYGRLGKYSRAAQVFAKAVKQADEAVEPARVELHLRHARFLAAGGHLDEARAEFAGAARLAEEIPPPTPTGTFAARWIQICAATERMALAYAAAASIKMAEEDVTAAVAHLVIAYRLWGRAASGIAHIAAASLEEEEEAPQPDTSATNATKSKDKRKAFCFNGKRLGGLQWYFAEALFEATFDIALALAQQGSVKECEYYLQQARAMVHSVRSSTLDARTASRTAEFETRRLRFDKTVEQIDHAISVLTVDGPEAVEIQRVKGELFSRQAEGLAADELFAGAVEHLMGLDKEFMSAETKMLSTRKDSILPTGGSREPLMPLSLGHMLRQRAWLMREGGKLDDYETIIDQLDLVPRNSADEPEQLLLEARVAMHDAFKYFKTDLFMSSLTESTIALTMGSPGKRGKDRQSTRHEAVLQLERASTAFQDTLAIIAARGRVEDVRQTCVSLALLGAFQTSLGHGSPATTASAAGTLASAATLTLHRQLLAAIDSKYADPDADDMDWPVLDPAVPEPADALQAYWGDVRARHADLDLLGDCDLSALPTNWAVVSITVTDDRNTMLVTRHQNGHEPIVFCIPLDRQGRREGEEESELFTFDAGVAEMRAILAGNDESIKSIKQRVSTEDRKAWWRERHDLDTRLGELLATIEFCWLGAFKTVLNPRLEFDPDALATFRERLDRIFHAAITTGGSDPRRAANVRLNDTLLACFATLSSKCRDEEVEDLVYFVLDLYQFHGIAVALAELDFDQIGVDVKAALSDLEIATGAHPESDEHLLLALDKNVQTFPWESIPILRGRAVSRIASLPLLLDQVALGTTFGADAAHRTVNTRKTRYFLNPSGDLSGTQRRFEDRLKALEGDGWEGITARRPSEAEMTEALTESDLVMYFGHGGGEEYLRSHKVRALRRCATTMLWGCSSGLLREQGDLDPVGTPHDYILAGAPCLVGNLWDVTDKDIDRITAAVMDSLGLAEGKLGEGGEERMSVVQAVSKGRSAARLQYLTGAALVVYGVPVYMA